MISTLAGGEERGCSGFLEPEGRGESPHLSSGPCLGIYEFEVLCSFSWLLENHRYNLGLIKLFPPSYSMFFCFPDGYCMLSSFGVKIFIFAHCLDMILSNTSFIYAFACF